MLYNPNLVLPYSHLAESLPHDVHSILIFIRPSFVSTMPWNPILFGPPLLPTLFSPLLGGRFPQGVTSRCMGLCMTGLLCTLIPGLTALLLKLVGSKSSSLLRLLLTFRVISAAVGPVPGWGVADLEGDDIWSDMPDWLANNGGVDREGESREISWSLIPEEEPRGRNGGGGVRLLSSLNVSQNSLPLEFRIACCLKLLDSPVDMSAIMSSSGMPSKDSCVGPKFGEEWFVDIEWCRGSRSMSLSLVRRTTSASRRTSVSIGVLSSAKAARIRAKVFVLGYLGLAFSVNVSRIDLPAYFPSS